MKKLYLFLAFSYGSSMLLKAKVPYLTINQISELNDFMSTMKSSIGDFDGQVTIMKNNLTQLKKAIKAMNSEKCKGDKEGVCLGTALNKAADALEPLVNYTLGLYNKDKKTVDPGIFIHIATFAKNASSGKIAKAAQKAHTTFVNSAAYLSSKLKNVRIIRVLLNPQAAAKKKITPIKPTIAPQEEEKLDDLLEDFD